MPNIVVDGITASINSVEEEYRRGGQCCWVPNTVGAPTRARVDSKHTKKCQTPLTNSIFIKNIKNYICIDNDMLQLDQWQKDILKCKSKYILLCKGRQIGGTTIMARKCAEEMLNNNSCRIIVVSLTEDQAQLVIIMVLNYLEKEHKSWIKKPYSKNITKNKIVLNNGSQVLSRPVGNTGDSVRGFTGDVLYINEASRMPESVFIAAKPVLLTTGGKIWMDSTPFGKQGYFYESWLNKHKRYKVFYMSSEEVIFDRPISVSWTKEQRNEAITMLEEEKKDMGELAYAQEYLGLFMEDLRRLCTPKWIARVCILNREERNQRALHFLGVDIARMGKDKGTFEIVDKVSPTNLRHVESIVKSKQYTTQTFNRILGLNDLWNFKKIGIDAGSGSLGVGIMDFLMKEPKICRKVEALNNRRIVLDKYNETSRGLLKEDMYDCMITLGEMGHLKLLNDPEVIASLESIQIEFVEKEGRKTMIKIWCRDADIVEGIIRAVYLANQKNINTSISWF